MTIIGDIADAARIAGIVSKVMRNPAKAVEDLLKDADSEDGKKVIAGLKEKLCERYHADEIIVNYSEDAMIAALKLNKDVETYDDVNVVYNDVVKDIGEILTTIESTGAGKLDIQAAKKKLVVEYVPESKSILVTIPLTVEIINKIRRR